MRRYHEEKIMMEQRAKKWRQLHIGLGYTGPAVGGVYVPHFETGRYRKTLRCAGCTRARCQVCHSEKYPKRIPTKHELRTQKDFEDNVRFWKED